MRGCDTFTEGLFTLKKLDDFVPSSHPLRVIRTLVNKALAEMGELFAQISPKASKTPSGRSKTAPIGALDRNLRSSRRNTADAPKALFIMLSFSAAC
jgi:hypothetical protein